MGNYIDDTEIRHVASDQWFFQIADRDSDGVEEDDKVTRAVSSAESEFESYCGRYDIAAMRALNPTPQIIVDVCVDLAIHAIAQMDEGYMTDAIRRRYEDRIAWLKLLAAGKVHLPVPEVGDALGTGNAARQTSNPRLFTRDSMSRL